MCTPDGSGFLLFLALLAETFNLFLATLQREFSQSVETLLGS
jgi:hypothetical protein